jgi:hypothetical protein
VEVAVEDIAESVGVIGNVARLTRLKTEMARAISIVVVVVPELDLDLLTAIGTTDHLVNAALVMIEKAKAAEVIVNVTVRSAESQTLEIGIASDTEVDVDATMTAQAGASPVARALN